MSSSLILIISSISLLFLLTNVENILSKPSGLYIPIKISLNAQFANNFGLPNRFALFIPSSKKGNGDLFIGGGPYFMPPHKEDLSKSLIRIPLIVNHRHNGFPLIRDPKPEYEYFVDVKSIKVDGKYVPFNTSLLSIDRMGDGGTKISTVDPSTILHTSIYEAVVNAFVKSATDKNITKISSEKPYGACFNSTTITNSKIGPNVPTVDLVFESKDKVYWRVYGTNSMVRLNSDVMCLGLIDGGSNASPSIVVGGKFLEDNLLEFDLVSQRLALLIRALFMTQVVPM